MGEYSNGKENGLKIRRALCSLGGSTPPLPTIFKKRGNMLTITSKKKFLELMNKGWEKTRYTAGNYRIKKKGHQYCCAMGAVAVAAGVLPGTVHIDFPDSRIFEVDITLANDTAGSKRAARAAVTKLLS